MWGKIEKRRLGLTVEDLEEQLGVGGRGMGESAKRGEEKRQVGGP